MKTSVTLKPNHQKTKRQFFRGGYYFTDNGTSTLLLCTQDSESLFGVVISSSTFATGNDNDGACWNRDVFEPFNGTITIEVSL